MRLGEQESRRSGETSFGTLRMRRRSGAGDFDDSVGNGLWRFLRQVVADAALDVPLPVPSEQALSILAAIPAKNLRTSRTPSTQMPSSSAVLHGTDSVVQVR